MARSPDLSNITLKLTHNTNFLRMCSDFLIPRQELVMKSDLFFYTGTGNSLWTARTLAYELGDAVTIPILQTTGNPVQSRADAVGVIFPVHIWGLPQRVIDFVNSFAADTSRY